MEKISEHLSFQEATVTSRKIDNTPNEKQLANIRMLAEKVFEPLRKLGGDKPIKVNSVFRSAAVNKAVGGASTSQHCANNGAAMDIEGISISNRELGKLIHDNLQFDQLIFEQMDKNGEPAWIHVSYNLGKNRIQTLKMDVKNGKKAYASYKPE